jgi:diguanylate cyclase (GGDEF)-like protein
MSNEIEEIESQASTIMIVDDTKENISVLRNVLENEGYKIGIALSGEKALELVPKLKPGLILLDLMMPGIDGYETCRRLKENPQTKDITVIFITAKNDSDDIIKGFEFGGVDYITKPFKEKEVCVRVKTHIELQTVMKKLTFLSSNDPLTGLLNRRSFSEQLEKEFSRVNRGNKSFSLVFSDIDFFKKINDQYGHDAGDEVLRQVSKLLKYEKRVIDFVCRWGGEEFLLLLPETDKDGGRIFAEKIRSKIEELSIIHDGQNIPITMSFGVSAFTNQPAYLDVIKDADLKLYEAKQRGRNRVIAELSNPAIAC